MELESGGMLLSGKFLKSALLRSVLIVNCRMTTLGKQITNPDDKSLHLSFDLAHISACWDEISPLKQFRNKHCLRLDWEAA